MIELISVVGFDATLSGLVNVLDLTQGSPTLRGNPGLNDGTPLGFRVGKTDAMASQGVFLKSGVWPFQPQQ